MKRPTALERRHFDRLASMSCLVCGRWDVVIHHVHSDGFKRIGKSHRRVVPLCPTCHTDGPDAVHRISHAKFNKLHGIDLLAKADELWADMEAENG